MRLVTEMIFAALQVKRHVFTIVLCITCQVLSGNLLNLRTLGLVYTCVGDVGIKSLQQLPLLHQLDITGCNNITDIGFKHLASFVKLRKLNASHTQVGAPPAKNHVATLNFLC